MKKHILRFVNKVYRGIKTFLLVHPIPLITPLFFRILQSLDHLLSARKLTESEKEANLVARRKYLEHWDRLPGERIYLLTQHPVAVSSHDHIFPRGTIFDNTTHAPFNRRVYERLHHLGQIRMLDLGCAGGGLVRSFLEDGHVAIGIEGSDISKRSVSGEWDNIPYHLFTCDIAQPFQVVDAAQNPFLFDLITAWEVFEHIPENKVPGVLENIYRHLKPGGYVIVSIDLLPDGNPISGAVYHQTLKPASWWIGLFEKQKFLLPKDHGFEAEDMVRGNGLTIKDWWPAHGNGIHIVAQKPVAVD